MTHPSPPTPDQRPSLLSPSTLEPVEIDLQKVVRVGMAIWAVALVTSVVLAITDVVDPQAVAVCVAGLALGVLGIGWDRRRLRRLPPGDAR